jgi:hypothetical protein
MDLESVYAVVELKNLSSRTAHKPGDTYAVGYAVMGNVDDTCASTFSF